MSALTIMRKARAALLVGFCIAICALAQIGCLQGPSDDPQPPTGGREYILDYNAFAAEINPILTAKGCDSIACHGGGIRGTFQLSPNTNKDIDLDFFQVGLQVNPANPAGSKLLTKPLDEAAGGDPHTADSGQFGFMSTSDPGYQAILNWIAAGEYQ